MPPSPTETELKFCAPTGARPRLEAVEAVLAGATPRAMTSIYYDTEKRALKRAGLALRVRRAGDDFTQTLKNAGDGALKRGEWEAKVKGPAPSERRLRATPAARLVKGRRLSPVFVVDVQRRSSLVREGETDVEVSLDEGRASAAGREADFLELELELKGGPLWGLFALARRLTNSADLTLSFTSKADRGGQLATPPRSYARKFKAPKLSAGMSAGAAFQAVARACLAQVAANAERLRQRASPEVVHQLRVGLRRLRSELSIFKKVVSDARLPALKTELKWLTGELDAARNLDVLLHGDYRTAVAHKLDARGLKALGARLRSARRMAYVRAASAVEGERFRRLMLELLIWVENGPWTVSEAAEAARERSVVRFAAEDLARRRRKIVRGGRRLAELSAERRHKLRIAAKKLRYGADVFVSLFDRPRRVEAFTKGLKEMQDALGELNDAAVGERLIHDAAVVPRRSAAEPAFAAGRIAAGQAARTAPRVKRAEAALRQFKEAKPFWS